MCVVLLAWNAWLTNKVLDTEQSSPSQNEEETDRTTVISDRVTDFSNDITRAVSAVQSTIVTVNSNTEETSRTFSGFIYNSSGNDCWIVTVSDVAMEDAVISVLFDNGIEVEASIVGVDDNNDIALLIVHPSFETTAIEIGDATLVHQGEYVIAIGARQQDNQSSPISFGIVSSPSQIYRSAESDWISQVLVSDVSLPRLSTGGALINMDGQLVGMLSSALSSSTQLSGMNSALSSVELVRSVEEMKNDVIVQRGYLGVIVRNVEDLEIYEKSAMNITLDTVSGVVVTYVVPESPASTYGIQKGDVITMVDGEQIHNVNELYEALYKYAPNDTVTFTLGRIGTEADFEMELQ